MDSTVDPSLKSFVEVAAESHFPIQNLPFGVFSPTPADEPRVGTRIGDFVLDLSVIENAGWSMPSVTAQIGRAHV